MCSSSRVLAVLVLCAAFLAPRPATAAVSDSSAVADSAVRSTGVRVSIGDEGVKVTRDGKTSYRIDLDDIRNIPNLKAILDSAGVVVEGTAANEEGDAAEDTKYGKRGRSVIQIESDVDDRVQVGDDIEILEGEVVRGDAVAIGGSVTIAGTVRGDAVAVGGNLVLDSAAVVGGDAVCIGGTLTREEGSVISGQVVSVGPGVFPIIAPIVNAPWKGVSSAFSSVFKVIQLLVMMLITYLILALWRTRVHAMAGVLPQQPLRLGLIGFLGWILVLPTCLLLVVSIIGILFLPVFFALLVFAFLAGLVAVYLFVGDRLGGGGAAGAHPVATAIKGLLVVHACSLVGAFLKLMPFLGPFPMVLSVFGKVVVFLAGTVGLGAVLYTRFGKRNVAPLRLPAGADAGSGGAPWRDGFETTGGSAGGAGGPPPFPDEPIR
jgi:hypothetical protein